MIPIRRFNQITIVANSLVVFDIDETLIKFDGIDYKWWQNKAKKFLIQTRDNKLAEQMANEELRQKLSTIPPELVDPDIFQFIQRLQEANCQIILLTARKGELRDMTPAHLSSVGLSFEHIYYNENKGDQLLQLVSTTYNQFHDIIVVDDMKPNLTDIETKLSGLEVNLHLYNIKE